MKIPFSILNSLLLFLLLTGCYREDKIMPTSVSVASKFEFPQGDSPADRIFEDIYEKYGVKVIYRNYTRNDIERKWASPPTFATADMLWQYITDPSRLEAAANILDRKVFSLLPEEIIRRAARAYPYMYLMDNLRYPTDGATVRRAVYESIALDAISASVQPNSAADSYSRQVWIPLRVALQYFMFAFSIGMMDLPASFYDDIGNVPASSYTSFARAENDPALYENFWARQGRIPFVSPVNGRISLGKNSGFQATTITPSPISERDRDVPLFFIMLSVDRNWRAHFEPGGAFYDCPRLERRCHTFNDRMKEYGIDFDVIREKLYEGTRVDTSPPYKEDGTPGRIWIRPLSQNDVENEGDADMYIYYDLNNYRPAQ